MTLRSYSFEDLPGKRLANIVIRKGTFSQNPKDQVFLVFDDNTYVEIWGELYSSGIYPGDVNDVIRYAQKFGDNLEVFSLQGEM